MPLSLGQIGCYLSHRKAWQEIVDRKLDYAIILEDDFTIDDSIHTAIANIEALDVPWQMIKLAAYNNRKRPIGYRKDIAHGQKLVIHKKLMTGCCATAITYDGAKQLLNATNKFGRPVDTDLQHVWETDVYGYSLLPYPVKQRDDQASDIAARSQNKQSKAFWRRKKQQIKAALLNWFYTSRFINRHN